MFSQIRWTAAAYLDYVTPPWRTSCSQEVEVALLAHKAGGDVDYALNISLY